MVNENERLVFGPMEAEWLCWWSRGTLYWDGMRCKSYMVRDCSVKMKAAVGLWEEI